MKDEFYVGYLPKAPKKIARFVIAFVVLIFIVMGAVSFFMSSSHKHINNGTYEFGELTEMTGVIKMEPVPHIRIIADEEGKVGKNIMLIDFGKFGARSSIEKMQETVGGNISDYEVTLRGTLIYQDGFTLLELTEKEKSLQNHRTLENANKYEVIRASAGSISLTGEIVDPKCYFGSMKPAQNKPHKSCASLCIAGGIPPVYVVQTKEKLANYYIIKGTNGEDINQEVLEFVAEGANLQGKVEQLGEWKILYVDPSKIKRLN
ncbi:hypothetical protein [Roseivirga misakiensis]|uniref:Uncharacterized protein n=1 Tax=Roseivirga misakiensis TaxID=1563681 RepID=A0A1E5T4H4_9BACT|nr:hypothetical protein [Roseivirga misakiensis]OEK06256.1 hypothetical protein BFP71_00850 [Roseivirga misakiensis]